MPAAPIARLDQMGAVVGRDRREGGGGVPIGDGRLGPQALKVIARLLVPLAVDLGEGAGVIALFDEIVPRLIAEAAGFVLDLKAAEARAAGIYKALAAFAVVLVNERRGWNRRRGQSGRRSR